VDAMSDLFETEFEGEDGQPLYETEDGRLVDESGAEYSWGDEDEEDTAPPSAEEVEQWIQDAIEEAVADEVGHVARDYSRHDPQARAEEEAQEAFDSDFVEFVEAVKREDERNKFSARELNAMYAAAQRANADPRTRTDADVWDAAKKEVVDLTDSQQRADYIDRTIGVPGQDDEEPAEETPAEYLAEIERGEDEYRERVEAVMAGDYTTPVGEEYVHPNE
jgi:hypothetical protein